MLSKKLTFFDCQRCQHHGGLLRTGTEKMKIGWDDGKSGRCVSKQRKMKLGKKWGRRPKNKFDLTVKLFFKNLRAYQAECQWNGIIPNAIMKTRVQEKTSRWRRRLFFFNSQQAMLPFCHLLNRTSSVASNGIKKCHR